MSDFDKFQKDQGRRSLFYAIARHNYWLVKYREKVSEAQRGWILMLDGSRERIFVEEFRRKLVRQYKQRYKQLLDELKYDSEKLAKLLFGEGYMD